MSIVLALPLQLGKVLRPAGPALIGTGEDGHRLSPVLVHAADPATQGRQGPTVCAAYGESACGAGTLPAHEVTDGGRW